MAESSNLGASAFNPRQRDFFFRMSANITSASEFFTQDEQRWCTDYMKNAETNRRMALNLKWSLTKRRVIPESCDYATFVMNKRLMATLTQYLSLGLSKDLFEANHSGGVWSDYEFFGMQPTLIKSEAAKLKLLDKNGNSKADELISARSKLLRFVNVQRDRLVNDMDLLGMDDYKQEMTERRAERQKEVTAQTPEQREKQVQQDFDNLADAEFDDLKDDVPDYAMLAVEHPDATPKELVKKVVSVLHNKVTELKQKLSGKHRPHSKSDQYSTPPSATEAILPVLAAMKAGLAGPLVSGTDQLTILEPCAGFGGISKELEKAGHKVLVFDKCHKDRLDFLSSQTVYPPYDIIVTNPPFRGKRNFLERACKLGKPFLMLLPTQTATQSPSMAEVFKSHGLKVFVITPTPPFAKIEEDPLIRSQKKVSRVAVGDMMWVQFSGTPQYKQVIELQYVQRLPELDREFFTDEHQKHETNPLTVANLYESEAGSLADMYAQNPEDLPEPRVVQDLTNDDAGEAMDETSSTVSGITTETNQIRSGLKRTVIRNEDVEETASYRERLDNIRSSAAGEVLLNYAHMFQFVTQELLTPQEKALVDVAMSEKGATHDLLMRNHEEIRKFELTGTPLKVAMDCVNKRDPTLFGRARLEGYIETAANSVDEDSALVVPLTYKACWEFYMGILEKHDLSAFNKLTAAANGYRGHAELMSDSRIHSEIPEERKTLLNKARDAANKYDELLSGDFPNPPSEKDSNP